MIKNANSIKAFTVKSKCPFNRGLQPPSYPPEVSKQLHPEAARAYPTHIHIHIYANYVDVNILRCIIRHFTILLIFFET